jgi:hypothetical protein
LAAAAVDSAALVAHVVPEVQPLVPAPPQEEPGRPVLAHLVVEAALPVDLLSRHSRHSCSAAMARRSP